MAQAFQRYFSPVEVAPSSKEPAKKRRKISDNVDVESDGLNLQVEGKFLTLASVDLVSGLASSS